MKLAKKSLHIPMLALSISVLSLLAFLPANKVNAQQTNTTNNTPKTIHITETNISNFNQSNKSSYQHKNTLNNTTTQHNHVNHHIYNALPNNNLKQNKKNMSIKAPASQQIHYGHIKKHLHHKYTRAVTPPNNISTPTTVHVHFHKTPVKVQKSDWFRAGLSGSEFKARQAIVDAESRGHWNILSYGHRCIGYFQLDPSYLGYKHGHVNLNHKHQVKVANKYVASRYGSWKAALNFRNRYGYY